MLFRGRDPYSRPVVGRQWGKVGDINPVSMCEWESISRIAITDAHT